MTSRKSRVRTFSSLEGGTLLSGAMIQGCAKVSLYVLAGFLMTDHLTADAYKITLVKSLSSTILSFHSLLPSESLPRRIMCLEGDTGTQQLSSLSHGADMFCRILWSSMVTAASAEMTAWWDGKSKDWSPYPLPLGACGSHRMVVWVLLVRLVLQKQSCDNEPPSAEPAAGHHHCQGQSASGRHLQSKIPFSFSLKSHRFKIIKLSKANCSGCPLDC